MFLGQWSMQFINDFWIKNQDASNVKAGTLDGMAMDSNLWKILPAV